jgi:predicted TIM-barrel fold metal-dependent hydrolase
VRDGRIFFGCEPGEYHIPHAIAELGEGCLLYSSDYPHGDSKWPHTVRMIRDVSGVSEDAQRKILGENAARFYGLAL